MKPWSRVLGNALISGSAASLASMLALAVRGRVDCGSATRPLNAPSHWIHGEQGTRQEGVSARYTLTGALTHHASALFWALLYERLVPDRPEHRSPPALLGHATLAAAIAAVADLKLVPQRLTPGFQRPLSGSSLWWVYASFAAGLAAGSYWAGHRHCRLVERRLTAKPESALPPAVSSKTQQELRHPGSPAPASEPAPPREPYQPTLLH